MRKLIFAMLVILCGCRTEPTGSGASTANSTFPTRQTYSIAAKSLHDRVKNVVSSAPLNLAIESDQDGRIVTAWQSNSGATVGVGPLARHWQERTRYTITISPAWDDPNGKSTIEVTEESQQRPHDKWEWGSQEPIKRPERAARLSEQIDRALRESPSSAK
jgi:hypothetical protein